MIVCPICDSQAFWQRFLQWKTLQLVRCSACGMAALVRKPGTTNQEKFDDIYAAAPALSLLTASRYKELLTELDPLRQTNTLLELGCGNGFFLAEARSLGWQAVGTEHSPVAINRLSQQGFRILTPESWAGEMADASCDAVVMLEVIEHVDDVNAVLGEIRRVLRPGGKLLLSTPNINSLTRRLIGSRWRIVTEEHLWYFSPQTLAQVLARAGLQVTFMESRNIYPPDICLGWRAASTQRGDRPCGDQPASKLRAFAAENPVGRALKNSINRALCATALGDTIWATAQRPLAAEAIKALPELVSA